MSISSISNKHKIQHNVTLKYTLVTFNNMKIINTEYNKHNIFAQTDVWQLISHFMVQKSSIQYIYQTAVWYSHTFINLDLVALRCFHTLPLKHRTVIH
jgi:hypothetical protein